MAAIETVNMVLRKVRFDIWFVLLGWVREPQLRLRGSDALWAIPVWGFTQDSKGE
jgi:hypothetical protein